MVLLKTYQHITARSRQFRVRQLGFGLDLHGRHGLSQRTVGSGEVFARKWSHRLPITTPCVIIDKGGAVHPLGNATPGPGSTAYPCRASDHRADRVEFRYRPKPIDANSGSGSKIFDHG
jgi:hypothetical protein